MSTQCDDALREKIRNLTHDFYEDAVIEVTGINKDDAMAIADAMYDFRVINSDYGWTNMNNPDIQEQKIKVDELYLKKILESSTDVLEEIIVVHNDGFIKRSSKVLESIKSELTRRALFSDPFNN